jgi:hypothetical protein
VTGPVRSRPLAGCPARQGDRMFPVTSASFVLDVRDYPADDGTGAMHTEIIGYFRPALAPDAAGADAGAGTDGAGAEPDLVSIAILDMPAGTPAALTAWRAFQNPAGPAAIGHAMRAAITACPCTFPLSDCAALDDDILRQAITQAAALTVNGQDHK